LYGKCINTRYHPYYEYECNVNKFCNIKSAGVDGSPVSVICISGMTPGTNYNTEGAPITIPVCARKEVL